MSAITEAFHSRFETLPALQARAVNAGTLVHADLVAGGARARCSLLVPDAAGICGAQGSSSATSTWYATGIVTPAPKAAAINCASAETGIVSEESLDEVTRVPGCSELQRPAARWFNANVAFTEIATRG